MKSPFGRGTALLMYIISVGAFFNIKDGLEDATN